MSEYVTLMGAECVQQAGHNISGAADTMSRSAESFGYHVERLERVLGEFGDRMEGLVARMEAAANVEPDVEPVITQDAVPETPAKPYFIPQPDYDPFEE